MLSSNGVLSPNGFSSTNGSSAPNGVSSSQEDSLRELIVFARQNSSYYKTHYSTLPDDIYDLNLLPIVDHTTFWAANSGGLSNNQVLTSPFTDGAVFRTGGTTATPKVSYVTREELRQGAQTMGQILVQLGLRTGDRVANFLYGGDLYKGFLELGLALTEAPVANVHLSIGVATLENQAWTMKEYAPTVMVAMPTIMCRLAEFLVAKNESVESVRLLLYLGELLHKEQKALLQKAYPCAQIGPMFYGSVDGGFIGISPAPSDADDESLPIYTVSDGMVMELVTDTEEIITADGQQGRVVITNLTRRLMPIIRYPMGDIASWVDYSARTFRLCGRGSVGVRVGPYSYDMKNIRAVISNVLGDDLYGFQVVLRRANGLDEMTFRIAAKVLRPEETAERLKEEMVRVHETWREAVDGFVNPLQVEWVGVRELEFNARSGKVKEIVELRCEV